MGIDAHDRDISSLVKDINEGRLLLPEMQRGYVWKSTQVRDLFDSLYRQYPSGQLLVWETEKLPIVRGVAVEGIEDSQRRPQLLLDGQQRLTSLAAVMLDKPLIVRDRSRKVEIIFNVFTEQFEVTTPRQRGQRGWVPVARVFATDPVDLLEALELDTGTPEGRDALKRMYRVSKIKDYKYRVNVLDDLDYSEVTHIFVRINSGGTKLGHADLALAQLSARWEGVTEDFAAYQDSVKTSHGWELQTRILLRAMTAVLTGQSYLSKLFSGERGQRLTVDDFQGAWAHTKPAMDQAINFVRQNCLVDAFSLLPTDNVLIPLVIFFHRYGGNVTEAQSRLLQRWFYMALIWSRYSSSVEAKLDQDIAALSREQPIEHMIQNIEDVIGRQRAVEPRHLQDELNNSPFMMMAYVLARQAHAKDWFNGVAIGAGHSVEFHHIFPRAYLKREYDARRQGRLVNQVANLAFISGRANNRIGANPPAEYLPTIEEMRLRAQRVPLDRHLWTIDHFEDFLQARRELLAEGINQLLHTLSDVQIQTPTASEELVQVRIGELERQMRTQIGERLTASFGPAAWRQAIPGDVKQAMQDRIQQRERQHPYERGTYDTLEAKLAFGQFSDYARIISANWAVFADIFGERRTFERHLQAVQGVRNALAHHRDTNRSELSYADGGLAWLEDCIRHAALRVEEASEDSNGDTSTEAVRAMASAGAASEDE